MTDVDKYIAYLQEKQEVDDFVSKGKYPDRLKSTSTKKYIPTLNERPLKEFYYEKPIVFDEMDTIFTSLNTIELELKREIRKENQTLCVKENECPICMNEIKEKNYVMPNCGHRVCVNCFVTNVMVNKTTGHICSVCRTDIIKLTAN